MSSYAQIVTELAGAQKPGHGVPPYTRYVNRPWGRRLAAASHLAGLTPNQVTALSMLSSGVGLALHALRPPSPALGVVVAAFLLLGYALDSADGQLARLRGEGGPAGEWVDHVSDQFRQGWLHACVLIAWWRDAPDLPPAVLLVPLAYGILTATRFLSQILAEQMRRHATSASGAGARTPESTGERVRAWLNLPVDAGVLCLAFALSGWPIAFFLTYTALFLGTAASTALSLRRRYAELLALRPA